MREATLLYIIESWVYYENKECSYFNRNGWTAWASFFLKKSFLKAEAVDSSSKNRFL